MGEGLLYPRLPTMVLVWGRFRTARAQRRHSAHYYGVYPGNIPENHPPTEACMIKFLVYQQGLWGAEFRTLGPMASSKPTVVENSQLFAKRAHSARCAPFIPIFSLCLRVDATGPGCLLRHVLRTVNGCGVECLSCCPLPCSGVHSPASADRLCIQSFSDREVWGVLTLTLEVGNGNTGPEGSGSPSVTHNASSVVAASNNKHDLKGVCRAAPPPAVLHSTARVRAWQTWLQSCVTCSIMLPNTSNVSGLKPCTPSLPLHAHVSMLLPHCDHCPVPQRAQAGGCNTGRRFCCYGIQQRSIRSAVHCPMPSTAQAKGFATVFKLPSGTRVIKKSAVFPVSVQPPAPHGGGLRG